MLHTQSNETTKKVETSKAGGWKSTIPPPPKACFFGKQLDFCQYISAHIQLLIFHGIILGMSPTHVGLTYCKAQGKIYHKWEGSYAYS